MLVASGPSAKGENLELARGRAFVAVINTSWRLAPWANALYAADYRWWASDEAPTDFEGLRITCEERAAREFGLRLVKCLRKDCRIMAHAPGTISGAGNSGFHLLDLAIQFSANPLLLVGYDMSIDNGLHWHGRHGKGHDGRWLMNPKKGDCWRWRKALDGAAKPLAAAGKRVVNCSPGSSLTAYPKMPLADALEAMCVSR